MRYSTIKRDSGLLSDYARERDAMTAMAESLTELREAQVILAFKRKNITGKRGKIEDAVFTLTPSFDFVKDTKAGSKRISMATAPSADIKNRWVWVATEA